MKIAPNRIAVYLTAVAALAAALAPIIGELDISSTAGVVAGLAALTSVVNKWLSGWQSYEDTQAWQDHNRFMKELDA